MGGEHGSWLVHNIVRGREQTCLSWGFVRGRKEAMMVGGGRPHIPGGRGPILGMEGLVWEHSELLAAQKV